VLQEQLRLEDCIRNGDTVFYLEAENLETIENIAAADDANGCIFLSEQEDWLIARADAQRVRARDARKDTPSIMSIYDLITGILEKNSAPGELFCELCGRSATEAIEVGDSESCRGCRENICGVCLWTRPGTVGEAGVCAHCVGHLYSHGTAGVEVPNASDAAVVSGAVWDEAFIDYAGRLGAVWDEAEERQRRCHD